jgi:uncharacterized membrane protein YfcA
VAASVIVFAIVMVAALAQAVTGFGFALVAVPLLALAIDPRAAVVTAGLAGLGATLLALVRQQAHVNWRTAGILLGCASVGLPLGLLILRFAPVRALSVLIAVTVLCCTVLVWRRTRLRHPGRFTLAAVGVLVGTLSTATGTSGPPLVALFQGLGFERHTFRATLAAVFSGTGIVSVAGFVAAGVVTPHLVWLGLVGLPAVGVGWTIGDRLFDRIDAARFRVVVIVALIATAAVTLARAITS